MSTSTLQEIFDRATTSLKDHKYKESIEELTQIRAQGFTSASIEDALGRSYVETGEIGKGMSHFTNAISLDRFNSNYRQNLRVAQEKSEAGLGLPMQHPAEWGHTLASYVRPAEFFSLASIFLLLAAAITFSRSSQRGWILARRWCLAAVILTTACGIFAINSRSIALITENDSIKAAPLESSETKSEVKAGARVHIIRKSEDYVEIERPNAIKGWVLASHIEASPF
jgi:hypothetical protein